MSHVQGAARSLKKYACPICTALKGHPGDLDAAIGRTKRTRSASFVAHLNMLSRKKLCMPAARYLPCCRAQGALHHMRGLVG